MTNMATKLMGLSSKTTHIFFYFFHVFSNNLVYAPVIKYFTIVGKKINSAVNVNWFQ